MSTKFWREFWTLVRFSVVGVAATAAYIIVSMAMISFGAVNPVVGSVMGFCASFLISYFGHFRFTFAATGGHRDYLLKFAVNSIAVLLFSTFMVWLVASVLRMDYRIAVGISAIVIPVFNYLVSRFWIFLHPAGTEPSRQPFKTI